MCDSTDVHQPGRPPSLDELKRKTILAMLANGSSRRVAAACVGCSPSTITRTAARDPDFDVALARAEQNSEVRALRCLQNATRNERYWRAAAWLLERKNPDDFAARKADVFTEQQIRQLFLRLMLLVAEDMPQKKLDQLMERLDELVKMLQETGDLGPPPPPPPDPGECPNFRGHRGEAVVDENGTVPFVPPTDEDFATRPSKEPENVARQQAP